MMRTVASLGCHACHDCRLFCKCTGANINEVPNSEKFSHSAGGPQLELRWGPGRAKRARARHTYTKTRKTAKSHLFSELGEMLGNTGIFQKKKNDEKLSKLAAFYPGGGTGI